MDEALKKLIERLAIANPLYVTLNKDERVGFVFAARWSVFSEIPGRYNENEILDRIRVYMYEH